MKKILITGANSYIGTAFDSWISSWPEKYQTDTLDMTDPSWREKDFSVYDVVYHVAGIAHSDSGNISPEKEKLYRSVNTDLTIETAGKAKQAGVRQFIFMSSIIVYGASAPIGRTKIITKDTEPAPENCYGDSKLQAENGLKALQDESFKVVILRPPMVYGKNCKGNYALLSRLAGRLPLFPYVRNTRSMIYIGNLVEFVRLMIDNEEQGTFFPQNSEYTNTSGMVQMIAAAQNRKIHLVKGFTWALKLLSFCTPLVNKAFGSLAYDMQLSAYKDDYRIMSLADSIAVSE